METRNVKQLLDKYYAGETTLQEEQQLCGYFTSANVAEELKLYQAMFAYMAEKRTTKNNMLYVSKPAATHHHTQVKRRRLVFTSISIAASLAIIISIVRHTEKVIKQPYSPICQGNFVMVDGKCTDDPSEIARHASQAIEAILSSQADAMGNLEEQLHLLQ